MFNFNQEIFTNINWTIKINRLWLNWHLNCKFSWLWNKFLIIKALAPWSQDKFYLWPFFKQSNVRKQSTPSDSKIQSQFSINPQIFSTPVTSYRKTFLSQTDFFWIFANFHIFYFESQVCKDFVSNQQCVCIRRYKSLGQAHIWYIFAWTWYLWSLQVACPHKYFRKSTVLESNKLQRQQEWDRRCFSSAAGLYCTLSVVWCWNTTSQN